MAPNFRDFLNKKVSGRGSNSSTPRITPGTYESVVTSVTQAEGYREGDAVKVEYSVRTENGSATYSEIFVNKFNNVRTATLQDYLESHGISLDEWETLEGLRERLTFEKQAQNNNRVYLNVADREFLGYEEDGEEA